MSSSSSAAGFGRAAWLVSAQRGEQGRGACWMMATWFWEVRRAEDLRRRGMVRGEMREESES